MEQDIKGMIFEDHYYVLSEGITKNCFLWHFFQMCHSGGTCTKIMGFTHICYFSKFLKKGIIMEGKNRSEYALYIIDLPLLDLYWKGK